MLTDEYITYVSQVRRYSSRTCELYSDLLREFAGFVGASDDAGLLEALVPSVIRSYEVHLLDAKNEDPRTVNLPECALGVLQIPYERRFPQVESGKDGLTSEDGETSAGLLPGRLHEGVFRAHGA